jgi:hypothetical protein
MAALEDRVLTKVLSSRSLDTALRRGLTEDHFLNHESKAIFRFLKQHWYNPSTYGELPTVERVKQRWPAFTLTANNLEQEGGESTLIDELKMKFFESNVWEMADFFKSLVEEDPKNALVVLKRRILELEERLNTEKVYSGASIQDVLTMAKEHYEGAQTGAIYGVPWPWPCLTEDTLGKRGGDFVVFYGRMKSMKTWLLLYCAAHDFLNNKQRVLVWSKEMSRMKLGLRMATLLAQVDYQLFKKGLLPPKMRDKCFNVLESLIMGQPKHDLRRGLDTGLRDLVLMGGRDAPKTLDELKAVIDIFQPHVVYLDSFYHLDTERSEKHSVRWQRVAAVAEDIKSYAEDNHLPIVAVHQANRLGEKTYGNTLADLADADVIGREADLIIRVLKPPGAPKELYEEDYEEEVAKIMKTPAPAPKVTARRLPRIRLAPNPLEEKMMERIAENAGQRRVGGELALVLGGNREGVLEAFTIKAIPSYNFSIISDRPDMNRIKEWVKVDDTRDTTHTKAKSGGSPTKPEEKKYEDAVSGI